MSDRSEGEAPTALWRNPNFVLLWSGQAVSIIGTEASRITFPLLVLYLTDSPFQAGVVGALQNIPFLILGLPAGVLVDRWNRKRLMIACDAARALAYASIPLTLALKHPSMAVIYAVVVVEGTAFSFFNLAEVSALPQVVSTEQIGQASAYNQAMWAAGSLAGPPLGGLLYGISRGLPFLADAVSYGASVVSLLFIRVRFQVDRREDVGSMRELVWEGMRWLWGEPLVRLFALLGGLQGLMFSALPLAVIVLARESFHASPGTIGFLFGLAAVGGIAGAVVGGWLQGRLSLAQAYLGGLWVSSLLMLPFALAPSLAILTGVGALIFFSGPVTDIAQFSYRMTRIPDTLQGRVNSLYRMVMWSGQPLGSVAGGALLQLVGPRVALLTMAGGMLLVAAVATMNSELRHARR